VDGVGECGGSGKLIKQIDNKLTKKKKKKKKWRNEKLIWGEYGIDDSFRGDKSDIRWMI